MEFDRGIIKYATAAELEAVYKQSIWAAAMTFEEYLAACKAQGTIIVGDTDMIKDIKLTGVNNKTTLLELLTKINTQRKKSNLNEIKRLRCESLSGQYIYWTGDTVSDKAVLMFQKEVAYEAQRMAVRKCKSADELTIGQLCLLHVWTGKPNMSIRYYW